MSYEPRRGYLEVWYCPDNDVDYGKSHHGAEEPEIYEGHLIVHATDKVGTYRRICYAPGRWHTYTWTPDR